MKSYRFVDGEYEIRQEIKRSVFIATVKGEIDDAGAEEFVKAIKKRYPDATHNCYAYISDEFGVRTRFSDDGEPGGTAGQPILEVLKRQDLRRTAIVVTRYFGGIKLGASGLVGAYSGAAAGAVKKAKIGVKYQCAKYVVGLDYADLAQLERAAREGVCTIDNVLYDEAIRAEVFVKRDEEIAFEEYIKSATFGRAQLSKEQVYEYKTM